MRCIQLKLLLWKNCVLIKRKPLITLLQILLPLVLFLILLLVRLKIPPVNVADKYYYAKPMPSAGYVPFIQSMLCDPISGRPEIRYEQYSSYKSYSGASIYPMISLVDGVVQLTDAYSMLLDYHTDILTKIFNVSDLSALDATGFVKPDPIQRTLNLTNSGNAGSIQLLLSPNNTEPEQMQELQLIFKRDLSDYITPPQDEQVPQVLDDEEDDSEDNETEYPLLDILQNKIPKILDLNPTPSELKKWTSSSLSKLDPKNRQRAEKSLEIMAEEYLKHKIFDKQPFKPGKADFYGHTEAIQSMMCNDPEFRNNERVQQSCEFFKSKGRYIAENIDMDKLSQYMLQISNRIAQSSTVVKLDLVTLHKASRTKYIQGVFCGTRPGNGSSTMSDEAARTLDVKLKLLADLKHTKIPYTPNNGPVREIIKNMNATFETAAAVRNFSLSWAVSAPRIKQCFSRLEENTSVLALLNQLMNCYKTDNKILPVQIRPWFTKFVKQQSLLEKISSSIQGINKTTNYSTLLQLHPILETEMSKNNILDDIDLVTETAKQYVLHTNDIDWDVFVPFDTMPDMEQWIRTSGELVWAGILFENVGDTLPPHVAYTLRMNGKVKVGTGEITERIWSPNPMNGFSHRRYEWSGFVFLQDIVDRAIITLQSEKAGGIPPHKLPASYVQEVPYPCHCWDAFLKNSITILPIALCLSFIYSVCVIVRNVVHEKETRIREAMQQMGLSNSVHWGSWFVTSMLQMSITATMLTFILRYGNIMKRSDLFLLWLFLHAGVLATISFCFLLSVFFSEAKLATAGSGLLYVIGYLPYACISQSEINIGNFGKCIVSMFSTSAIGMGCEYIIRFEEQGVGLQWTTLTQGVTPTDEYNMLKCLFALLFDAVVYILLALYIEGVFPGRYGVPKPWHFPLKWIYWNRFPSPNRKSLHIELPGHECTADVELPPDLTCGISITNLTKKYSGMDKNALSALSLDLYENQILAFLGHNGAGKTTTMSILSGLYPPSSGTATIYGKDIKKDMKLIRQELGVCPQFNVLFEHLTVEEHLWFFASLKGTSPDKIREEVSNFLKNIGMDDKRTSFAHEISGGMKRKLCVAMAFVGGSRVIILDEPTAGVDPWSRRSIWELVLKHKADRTILLSTHHMDEADLLGDRVAIISQGKLLCCGSPLYLKSRFGPGYYLNIEKDNQQDVMEDSGIADQSLELLDQPISPVSSRVPVPLKNKFSKTETTKLIKCYVPNATMQSQNEFEICYLLPWEAFQKGVFPDLFKALDDSLEELGIKCYGVMDSTLEEVFLSVSDTEKGALQANPIDYSGAPGTLDNQGSEEYGYDAAKLQDDTDDDELLDTEQLIPLSKRDIPASSDLRQIRAQLAKRTHHTKRDWKTLVFQLILPALFVFMAMTISLIRPHFDSGKKLELSVSMFKHPYYVPFADNSTNGTSRLTELIGYPAGPWSPDIDEEVMALRNFTAPKKTEHMPFPWHHYHNSPLDLCGNNKFPRIPAILEFKSIQGYVLQNLTGWNLEKFLVQTNKNYIFQRYGAFTFGEKSNIMKKFAPKDWDTSNLPQWGIYNPYTAKAWHSFRGVHALPTYLSGVNNLILRSALPSEWKNLSSYGVTVSSHPLTINGSGADIWEMIDEQSFDLVISMFMIIALSFVPASFVLFLVSERVSSLYLLQCIAGGRIVPYWVSNFIWDLMSFTVANAGCLLVIVVFRSPCFASADNIPVVFALFTLYAWSITPLMYTFSKMFKEPNNAYVIMICINTFCGITTTLTTFLLELLASNDIGCVTMNNFLKYFFLLLPNYCLGRGLMDLATNQFINDIREVYSYPTLSPWRWELIGRNLVFMALIGVLFILITFFLSIPRRGKRRNVPNVNREVEDCDVRAERQRTIYSYTYNDTLKCQNLCKVYKKHVAVNRLAFSVSPGECFGLLGINGAGKTTTFKMLTGEIKPTNGDAVIAQISLNSQLTQARRQMGYCPQTDALLPSLTSYETLSFFARLRGIPESQVNYISRQIIRTVGLNNWASKPCGTYSGGNKRKLSAAITLMGEPRLILLDEPTAGMDPGARRALWSVVLAQKRKGKAVVLTSHSMHECEALCSRIAIMVAGRIRCIGSAQHLREKYGNGYVILLKLNPQQYDVKKCKLFIQNNLSDAVLKAEHYCTLKYEIKKNSSISVGDIFHTLQLAKPQLNLLDYAVHQTNLEQVFINFAQSAESAQDDELLCCDDQAVPPSNLELSFD